jgi:hypothetical protein
MGADRKDVKAPFPKKIIPPRSPPISVVAGRFSTAADTFPPSMLIAVQDETGEAVLTGEAQSGKKLCAPEIAERMASSRPLNFEHRI